jgi:tripartite-type tricarboxylate transporter receptor subunit TctC
MASAGNGTAQHVAGELFKMMTGVDMVHVPYRGQAPALADPIGGRVQVMFAAMPSSIEYVRPPAREVVQPPDAALLRQNDNPNRGGNSK